MQLQVIEDITSLADDLVFNEEEMIVSMADTLTVQNNSVENLNSISKTLLLRSLDVFVFEVTINLLKTSEDGGYGLILGWDGSMANNSMNNLLRFLLDQSGRFSIDFIHDGNSEQITVQQSEAIRTGLSANKITVHKTGEEINFLINDIMVFTVECPLFGPRFGIILGPQTSISVETFHFATEELPATPPPVPPIPDMQTQEFQEAYDPTILQRPRRRRGRKFLIFLLLALAVYLFFYIGDKINHRNQYRYVPQIQDTARAMNMLVDTMKK